MARVRKKIGEATSLGDGKCVLKQLLEKHGRHAIHLLSQMRQPGSCSLLLPFELKGIPRFISDHTAILSILFEQRLAESYHGLVRGAAQIGGGQCSEWFRFET